MHKQAEIQEGKLWGHGSNTYNKFQHKAKHTSFTSNSHHIHHDLLQ